MLNVRIYCFSSLEELWNCHKTLFCLWLLLSFFSLEMTFFQTLTHNGLLFVTQLSVNVISSDTRIPNLKLPPVSLHPINLLYFHHSHQSVPPGVFIFVYSLSLANSIQVPVDQACCLIQSYVPGPRTVFAMCYIFHTCSWNECLFFTLCLSVRCSSRILFPSAFSFLVPKLLFILQCIV